MKKVSVVNFIPSKAGEKKKSLVIKLTGKSVVAIWCNHWVKHIDKIKANNTFKGKSKQDSQKKMGHTKGDGSQGLA